jgi:hypothetical protein
VALRPSKHPGDAMVGRRLAEIAVALYGAGDSIPSCGGPHAYAPSGDARAGRRERALLEGRAL